MRIVDVLTPKENSEKIEAKRAVLRAEALKLLEENKEKFDIVRIDPKVKQVIKDSIFHIIAEDCKNSTELAKILKMEGKSYIGADKVRKYLKDVVPTLEIDKELKEKVKEFIDKNSMKNRTPTFILDEMAVKAAGVMKEQKITDFAELAGLMRANNDDFKNINTTKMKDLILRRLAELDVDAYCDLILMLRKESRLIKAVKIVKHVRENGNEFDKDKVLKELGIDALQVKDELVKRYKNVCNKDWVVNATVMNTFFDHTKLAEKRSYSKTYDV